MDANSTTITQRLLEQEKYISRLESIQEWHQHEMARYADAIRDWSIASACMLHQLEEQMQRKAEAEAEAEAVMTVRQQVFTGEKSS